MTNFIRTDSSDQHFIELVRLLDADLAIRDGDDHAFYAQFNKIQNIPHVIVAFEDKVAIACGALKPYDNTTLEVKRMYTLPAHRGKGIAAQLLGHLETWATELGYHRCILETGFKQPEAIALYTKCAYRRIPNYGQYSGIDNSACFEKKLF